MIPYGCKIKLSYVLSIYSVVVVVFLSQNNSSMSGHWGEKNY